MSKTVLSNTNLLWTCAWYRQLVSKTMDISSYFTVNSSSPGSDRCLICRVKFCSFYPKSEKAVCHHFKEEQHSTSQLGRFN